MDYENIFYENELKYRISNREIINNFISSFCSEVNLDTQLVKLIYGKKCDNILGLFVSLGDYVFMFAPELINPFYDLLRSYGFKMHYDVFNCMYSLGYSFNEPIKKVNRDYVFLSPNVNDVKYNQGKITISSKDYGNYSFCGIKSYYSKDLSSYIEEKIKERNEKNVSNCHDESWRLIKYIKDGSLITFLMPYYFEGTIYHSVVRDENGLIVDFANGIVYDDSVINELLQGKIICETRYEDLGNRLYDAKMNALDLTIDFNKPLLLALYKQSKERKEI